MTKKQLTIQTFIDMINDQEDLQFIVNGKAHRVVKLEGGHCEPVEVTCAGLFQHCGGPKASVIREFVPGPRHPTMIYLEEI